MSEIGREFNKNLSDGLKWGGKIGGFIGGTITALVSAILFSAYNGWVKMKENEKGGKDIEAGIDGKNENLLLKKIASEYLGNIPYTDLKDKAFELNASLENFDKDVWEKYCKDYGVTYSSTVEVDVDGKEKTKIHVHEEKARDLEKVFSAYNREMQSRENTQILDTQFRLIDSKAKEENLNLDPFIKEYEGNNKLKSVVDKSLLSISEAQDRGELKFGASAYFLNGIVNILPSIDKNHPKFDVILEENIKYIEEKLYADQAYQPKKITLTDEEILNDPKVSEKINNKSFTELKDEILSKDDVLKELKKQSVEKKKNIGSKSR